MLYATTRSKVATYTAQRALKEDRSLDGGFYVPTAWPHYDRDALTALLREPAAEIVARILNDFFKKDLGKLDVEFALGKRFFGITDISHRIFIGELWRSGDWSFEASCRRLTRRISALVGDEANKVRGFCLQTFQREDLMAIGADSQSGAGQNGLAVHQHGAKTAVGGVAAPLDAEAALLPQKI